MGESGSGMGEEAPMWLQLPFAWNLVIKRMVDAYSLLYKRYEEEI